MFKKKYIVWWGSTLESSRVKNKIVNKIRRRFFYSADSFITYGSEATKCLEYYGVSSNLISTGYNTVDIKYYYKNKVLKEKSSSNTLNFLYIGQLIPRKGLIEIINCLSLIREEDWSLKIIGGGPLEGELKTLVKKLSLGKKISFEGYMQKQEILNYLVSTDVLVFPSLIEVWGLVVNEAIATNTFVMASKYAGATKDIIIDERNGLVIDPLDEKQLLNSFSWLFNNRELIKKGSSSPYSVWKKIHPNTYAKAVKIAINKALG